MSIGKSIGKSWVDPKSHSGGSNKSPKTGTKAGTMRSRIWKPRRWGQEPWGALRHPPGFLTGTLFENIHLDHQLHFPDEETRARVITDLPSNYSGRPCARLPWIAPFSCIHQSAESYIPWRDRPAALKTRCFRESRLCLSVASTLLQTYCGIFHISQSLADRLSRPLVNIWLIWRYFGLHPK